MLRNDVDHLATLRAEYRDQNKDGMSGSGVVAVGEGGRSSVSNDIG
jgi:hypothetical protein